MTVQDAVPLDRLRAWFAVHGGSFHPAVVLDPHGHFGVAVLAPSLDRDTAVVSCPFDLVVTSHAAEHALRAILGTDAPLDAWSERQLVCSYLAFHRLCPEQRALRHHPYVQSLPRITLTPLHFTTPERELLRGTNLYGATLDRERDGRAEWAHCRSLVHTVDPAWGDAFTWDVYLAALTHLSSRAFPSSILSPEPSLVATPSTYPILVPGVDLLNHKRGRPVSWIVSAQDATISIVVHPESDPEPGQGLVEVFNNYGPKPNDELILGYGFSLQDNPDDTIALQLGGGATTTSTSHRWVVGRNAKNVDTLWSEFGPLIATGESDYAFEDDLDTASVLTDMVQAKLDGMKTVADVRNSDNVRPAVRVMLEHYIAGQRAILESILEFLDEKQEAALRTARELGVDLVFEDEGTD